MSDYPMLISNKLHSFRNFVTQIYEKEYAFTNTYLITQAFYPPYYPPKNTISRTSTFAKYIRIKAFS